MKHLTVFLALATAAISVTAQSDCTLQYDGNGDGNVNSTDMLGLLSEFGLSCLDTTTNTVGFQNCGDPISYQGYDYATVLIGEQCWFAENLRTALYNNGDSLLLESTNSDWVSMDAGAASWYGNDEQFFGAYGRLYNWHAVHDDSGLCPSGWHVPSLEEWTTLRNFLGGTTEAGGKMKTVDGWDEGGNGSNSSGFSGLPGGYRYSYNGNWNGAGNTANFWTSTANGNDAFCLNLSGGTVYAFIFDENQQYGFSVRCIKDSE